MAAHTLARAETDPDRPALEVLNAPGVVAETWTIGEMETAIRGTATGLSKLGIVKGDRILLRLGNSSAFPIAFFAAITLGAIPVPVSSQLTETEITGLAADLEPALICRDPDLSFPDTVPFPVGTLPELIDLRKNPPSTYADTAAHDPAYMVYTSGSGGSPKGVVHAQRAAWARRMMWEGWYGLTPSDRVLHAGAFNWTYTLGAGLTDPWAIGATALIYTGKPDRHIWPELARNHHPTIFAAVPGVYRQMLGGNLTTGFASLRHGLSAGEAMPAAVAEAWSAATGKPIYEALGMSEVSTYISFSPSRPPVPGRAGYPQPGRRIAILADTGTDPVPTGEDGLLAVSSRDPGLMLEYWRRPEDTKDAFRGEWFLTGDRARMDADGAITYLGRADDLMNAGGFRVNPAEIEAVLLQHPNIAEAAAAEITIGPGKSIIAAFVSPKHGSVNEKEISDLCAARLARYKCPRAFHVLPTLPRSANGKILRRKLKEDYGTT